MKWLVNAVYPKSWLLSVVTALALQKRTVGCWIPVATVWKEPCSVLFLRGFEEVGQSGWNMSWEWRWNQLGVHHSTWSVPCVHSQGSCSSHSAGMLEFQWKRHLDLHLTEAGVWISYKMFGGCCGYWESREMPEPPAWQCCEENPAALAGAGLGRCVLFLFCLPHPQSISRRSVPWWGWYEAGNGRSLHSRVLTSLRSESLFSSST